MGPIELHLLTPERQADFLQYLEGPAFSDHPEWRSCYCQFLHVDHSVVQWSARTGEQNRAAACEHICNGRMQGLLAYRDGQVVGWCNASPRALQEAFADEVDADTARIGQISCFVVALPHRCSGVARALLEAACEALQAQGMTIAEAAPRPDVQTDAANCVCADRWPEGLAAHQLQAPAQTAVNQCKASKGSRLSTNAAPRRNSRLRLRIGC
jgi:GNAT superfamily N-acetyltransferase